MRTTKQRIKELFIAKGLKLIPQNTVYYTLSALKEAGLISEVNVGHEHARFDANMDRHHHLVCVSCQEINDLYDGTLDRLSMSSEKGRQYTILGHRVEFYGYCKRCQEKSKGSSRPEGRSRRAVH